MKSGGLDKCSNFDLEEFIRNASQNLLSDHYHMVLGRFPAHERDQMLDEITSMVMQAQNELDKRTKRE